MSGGAAGGSRREDRERRVTGCSIACDTLPFVPMPAPVTAGKHCSAGSDTVPCLGHVRSHPAHLAEGIQTEDTESKGLLSRTWYSRSSPAAGLGPTSQTSGVASRV